MAPGVGIEPTLAESKSVVLPLHYPGTEKTGYYRLTNALPNELIFHQENVGVEPTTYRLDRFAVSIPKLLVEPRGFEPRSRPYEWNFVSC